MDVLHGKIKPLYIHYLVAASGSALVASIFGLIDAMMVGRYHGPSGNAALAVFNPLWSIIYCLGLLAGIGGSVLFANNRGSGKEENAQQYFTLSVLYGAALSVMALLGIGFFKEEMFRFFGADDELLSLALRYLKPVYFAIPCCIFSQILSAALRNDGNPGLATKAVIIGGVFNAIGDYLCVFVLDLGIFGAGLATAIGQYIGIAIMLSHFFGKKNTLRFVRPVRILHKIGRISLTGFSTAISDLSMGIIGILFNRQIMRFLNADALAVYGIITQITAFAQCLAYGIGQAAQPIISQNYGARQYGRIRQCLRYALFTSAGMGLFWMLLMQLCPQLFLYAFMSPTPQVAVMAPGILRAYGLSYLLLPFNIFATYYFQAMMKPQLSTVASLARGVVISGGMILLLPLLLDANSLWYAMLITEMLVTVYSVHHTIRCTKKLI
ncbi:MAG: polysaccharide biosynthesis C-terminal domain-containing protein [Clostridia bacterium]|nr:polysaccharide biosynthesis C-terminal domain-containing protein [Clostridia bacterium]